MTDAALPSPENEGRRGLLLAFSLLCITSRRSIPTATRTIQTQQVSLGIKLNLRDTKFLKSLVLKKEKRNPWVPWIRRHPICCPGVLWPGIVCLLNVTLVCFQSLMERGRAFGGERVHPLATSSPLGNAKVASLSHAEQKMRIKGREERAAELLQNWVRAIE